MMRNMRIKAPRRPSSLSKTFFLSISRILSPQPIEENYTPTGEEWKDQISNTKSQITNNSQYTITRPQTGLNEFGILLIGIYLRFGAWNLVLLLDQEKSSMFTGPN